VGLTLTGARDAELSATMVVMYRHATTIAALPMAQREARFNAVNVRLGQIVKKLDLPSAPTAEWIDLMMKIMRAMVSEIETGWRGANQNSPIIPLNWLHVGLGHWSSFRRAPAGRRHHTLHRPSNR
jgi:hypothetical protein